MWKRDHHSKLLILEGWNNANIEVVILRDFALRRIVGLGTGAVNVATQRRKLFWGDLYRESGFNLQYPLMLQCLNRAQYQRIFKGFSKSGKTLSGWCEDFLLGWD